MCNKCSCFCQIYKYLMILSLEFLAAHFMVFVSPTNVNAALHSCSLPPSLSYSHGKFYYCCMDSSLMFIISTSMVCSFVIITSTKSHSHKSIVAIFYLRCHKYLQKFTQNILASHYTIPKNYSFKEGPISTQHACANLGWLCGLVNTLL